MPTIFTGIFSTLREKFSNLKIKVALLNLNRKLSDCILFAIFRRVLDLIATRDTYLSSLQYYFFSFYFFAPPPLSFFFFVRQRAQAPPRYPMQASALFYFNFSRPFSEPLLYDRKLVSRVYVPRQQLESYNFCARLPDIIKKTSEPCVKMLLPCLSSCRYF